jgi:hypothetical protein
VSNRRVISVGNRRDYPRELWGPLDHERERLEWARLEGPLTHAPGGPPPDLKFRLFETPATGGARSKAIDELLAKHGIGRRVAERSALPAKSSRSAAGRRVNDSAKPGS